MCFSLTFSCDSDETQDNESNRQRHEGKEESSDEHSSANLGSFSTLDWGGQQEVLHAMWFVLGPLGDSPCVSMVLLVLWAGADLPSGVSFLCFLFYSYNFFSCCCLFVCLFLPFSALFGGRSIKQERLTHSKHSGRIFHIYPKWKTRCH